MKPKRVLLVEVLDAAGADPADAREHGDLLRATGATVEIAIVSSQPRAAGEAETGPARGRVRAWHDLERSGLDALRDMAAQGSYDLALVASASPGGGRATRSLMSTLPTRWWPTGVAAAPRWWGPGGAAPPRSEDGLTAAAGLEWSSVDGERASRGRPTLWDGDYVLVPLAPAGSEGARVMAAFAEAAAEHPALDLLVLADRQPELERHVRASGLGGRVHFTGPAPREAEWTWWRYASAALLAGAPPCSGGLILRGLAVGCPLVIASDRREWAAAAAWLAHHRCLPAAADARTAPGARLAQTLERGAEIQAAAQRGRELAAAHDPARLAPRLAAAVEGLITIPATIRPAAAA